MRKKLSLILAAALVFTSAQGTSTAFASGSSYKTVTVNGASVILMDNVTSDMTSASYWTSLADDASSVLTDDDEISDINEGGIEASGTYQVDIENYSSTVSLSSLVSSAESDIEYYVGTPSDPKTQYGKDSNGNIINIYDTYYDSNGNSKTEAEGYFYNALENVKSATVCETVKYALPVKYTTMNFLPADIPVYDDEDDPDFDNQYLSGLRINEPVVIRAVSNDSKWYFVRSSFLSGWVATSDLAICASKSEWLSSWKTDEEDTLVVYGYKVYTEDSNADTSTANVALTMGTKVPLVSVETEEYVSNRTSYYNYVIKLPTRDDAGNYVGKNALISESDYVSIGYLEPTSQNIINVAMSMLGKRYGWGGMLSSDDCSQYTRNIYACFGIDLPRNTTYQRKAAIFGYDVSDYSDSEKEALLDHMPPGTLLYFPWHTMMYLGSSGGNYYVISSVSSMANIAGTGKQRIRSVVINTLNAKRVNGKTWLTSLVNFKIPWRYKDPSVSDTSSGSGVVKDASGYTVSLSSSSYTYDGLAKTPDVTVTDSSGNVVSSRYYTVSYDSDTASVGTHKVTVDFGYLYSGSATASYTISQQATATRTSYSIKINKTTLKKLKARSKGFKITWNKRTDVTGYEIQYSTKKNFKTAVTTTVKAAKKTLTIKKLSSKKKYYVRIRCYKKIDGVIYYSAWSKAKKVKTK